jgi:hypothetical protein
MAVNIYSFFLGKMLAEKAFEDKGVPNPDRANQLGLFAALFSPSSGQGGGIGKSVLPAVIVQQTAIREAEGTDKEQEGGKALVDYFSVLNEQSVESAARRLRAAGFRPRVLGQGTQITGQEPQFRGQKLKRGHQVTLKTNVPDE